MTGGSSTLVALQYDIRTGAELFGVSFGFLASSGFGWGGNIGVYKVGCLTTGLD